jgi:hypothetical protein
MQNRSNAIRFNIDNTGFILNLHYHLIKLQMPKENKNTVAADKVLKTVTEQLTISLTSLKAQLGKKKFNKRITKAAKILIAGIEKKRVKKTTPIQIKKAAEKKSKARSVKKKAAKPVVKKTK